MRCAKNTKHIINLSSSITSKILLYVSTLNSFISLCLCHRSFYVSQTLTHNEEEMWKLYDTPHKQLLQSIKHKYKLLYVARHMNNRLCKCDFSSPIFSVRPSRAPPYILLSCITNSNVAGSINNHRYTKEVALELMMHNGLCLQYLPTHMRDHAHIVATACKNKTRALQFASRRLRACPSIAMICLHDKNCITYVSDHLRDDYKLMSTAVRSNAISLAYASHRLKKCTELVMAAVSKDGDALRYASDECKDDEVIVSAAVRQYYRSIRHASTRLRTNERLRCLVMECSCSYSSSYILDLFLRS